MTEQFQVDRDDYTCHRIVSLPHTDLADGQIRVRVDRFAFTANNMTYAVAGDVLRYWEFFPVSPAESGESGNWGVIPVWAFGDVVESRCPGVPEGDRLYGYFPPATSVVMTPGRVSAGSLIDGAEHRQTLPPLYNRYRRVSSEPEYDPGNDDATVLLAPLHMTSFVLGHRLSSREYHDADQVVIVSASSKTSLGLAYALSQAEDAPDVVGLTSAGNVGFVEGTGLYDQVLPYDAVGDDLTVLRTVVVDMAGNAVVAAALQDRLGDDLAFSVNVGLTHWEDMSPDGGFGRRDPERNENFFAPSYILELVEQSGPGEFDHQSAEFLRRAAQATFGWMSVDRRDGLAGLAEVYADVRDGTLPPSSGVVVEI